MSNVNYWAVGVSALSALMVSFLWYSLFGARVAVSKGAAESSTAPAWKIPIEVLRSLVVALVLAGLAARLGIADWLGAVGLAAAAWMGFPVAILAGSVLWENVPWRLAAIHMGDWLVKLVVIALIVGLWR